MTVLSLRFCARAFSSCGKWGSLFIAVRGPLTIAASLVVEHRLQMRRLSNCGSRAQSLRGMWDLPRPGLEPVSPALAGRFSTTAPPGKPCHLFLELLLKNVIMLYQLSSTYDSLWRFVLFPTFSSKLDILSTLPTFFVQYLLLFFPSPPFSQKNDYIAVMPLFSYYVCVIYTVLPRPSS